MSTSVFPLALATLIAVYSVVEVSCGDQCFNIDEIQEQTFFPCNPSAPTSSCCQSGWNCLSNGLCEPGDNTHPNPTSWTGFCTDPLWGNTTACPKICQNNLTAIGVDNRVSSCGDGHFCCWVDNNGTCCPSSNVFSLGVATVVTNITAPSSTPAPIISITIATSAATSTLPMSAVANPSDLNAPATSNTHLVTSKNHTAVGVGVGVGVPVGLAILAGFFYLVRRQPKTRPEGLLEMHAVANGKDDNGLREPRAETWESELSAEYTPPEMSDPRGPRAEL